MCFDLPMCTRRRGDGCPHSITIPLPQLRHSAQTTDCQICHVLFGALKPFLIQADQDSLQQMALVGTEGSREYKGTDAIMIVRQHGRAELHSQILKYDINRELRFRDEYLYTAELFISEDECPSICRLPGTDSNNVDIINGFSQVLRLVELSRKTQTLLLLTQWSAIGSRNAWKATTGVSVQ